MIQVGILGAGFMGTTHARAFKKLNSAQVAVIADMVAEKAERLSAEIGCRMETDLEPLLNDPKLDVIDVTLPTPFHTEYAVRAMQAGKHVLVEKPLALSVEEADEIIAASEISGKFLMVAHVLRFWPEYVAIYDLLHSGKLGKPLNASAYRLTSMPQWATWFQDPKVSGGVVLDLAVHDIDILNWLFGVPETVYASGAGNRNGNPEDPGTVLIQSSHGDVKTTIESSFIMPKDMPFMTSLRVLCEGGAIEYKFQAGGASVEQGQAVNRLMLYEPEAPAQMLSVPHVDAYEAEIAYFIQCLETNKPPVLAPGQAGRDAVNVSLSARRSILSGEPVKIQK